MNNPYQIVIESIILIYLFIILFCLLFSYLFYLSQDKKLIFKLMTYFWLSVLFCYLGFGACRYLSENYQLTYAKYILPMFYRPVSVYFAKIIQLIFNLPQTKNHFLRYFLLVNLLSFIAHYVFIAPAFFVAIIPALYVAWPLIMANYKVIKLKKAITKSDWVLISVSIFQWIHILDYPLALIWGELFMIPGLAVSCCLTALLGMSIPFRVLEYAEEESKKNLILKLNENTIEISALYKTIAQKEKKETISSLASGIGHELNSPLAVIQASNNIQKKLVLSLDSKMKIKFNKIIQSIDSAVEKSSKIASFLTSINKTMLDENLSEINFNNLIEDLINNEFKNQGAIIEVDNQIDKMPMGNYDTLKKVLMILFINSKEELQSRPFTINIKTKLIDNYYCIDFYSIETKILEENKNYIFDPFYTTKDMSLHSGTGLTTAKIIISNMMGSIDLISCDPVIFRLKLQI